MSPRPRLLVAALLTLTATACVHTNATMLGTAPSSQRQALPEDQVRIFRTAAQVPGTYEEIALINSSASSGFTNEDKMMRSMKKKAGQLGANAIVLDAISEPSAGAKIAGAFLGTGAERKGKALAIFYTPKPAGADSAKAGAH